MSTPQTTTPPTTGIDPPAFRDVLGHWPSGVVVVTGMVDGTPSGMACNSFTSVSLEPPLVGFFPAVTSSTWPGIRDAGRFCVNVLASHHESVSRTFAARGIDRFAEIGWHDRAGSPALDEAVAWIDCTLEDELPTGDHTLVLGRVQAMAASADGEPLVFHRGRYAAVAFPLD